MPHILGAIFRLARTDLGVSQVAVAALMRMPQSTISKLERGTITHGVYHLDLFAQAIAAAAEAGGIDAEPWEGWELLREASGAADWLAEDYGLTAYWVLPRAVEDPRFVEGRELLALMNEWWEQ